jgi:ankyrin repeat protein
VAAIVCDFRYVLTRDEGSAKGLLLRTLLYQILESNPSILSCLQTSLKVTSPLPERPEDLEDHHYERWLVKALIAASMNARVFIVIDGLDECTYAVQNDILAWIELFCTATSLHPRPRIVVTSRRERPIKQVRQGYPTKRIHVGEQNTQAIAKYCSAMLYSRLAEPVPSMVTRDVRDSLDIVVAELTTRAKGIFLWASLAVDMLTRDFLARRGTFPDKEELRKALKDIPTGLDSLYECLLDRLCLSRRSKFLYVAAWILFAVRPLTLDELNTALQYDVSQPEHSAHDGVSLHGTSPPIMCKGLIEIAPDPLSDTKTVRLVHFTVKEYLLGAGARHVMSSGSANTRITEACVKHLDYCIGNRLRPNYPLFEYAVLHWRFHAEIGDTGGIAQDCLIEAFQWPSLDRISCWSTVYQQLRFPNTPSRSPKRTSLLHVASQYGLRNTIQTLRVKDTLEVLLNAIDDVGYTPLHLACKLGHVDTVSILLSFGADTQATDQDNYTPLHIAARYGHLEVVRLLLAEQNPESFKASHESALYCAVRNGNIDIVKFLIERGADPNCLDRQGNSILTLAASLGNEAVAELALSLENTKWPPSNYGIALVFAAAFGLSGLARSLLHLDETLEHRTPILQQTLITAITYTSEEIADILLVPGCDPNVTNGHDHQHGQSALSMAAASGSERMVNLLLRRGANPNIRDIHTQCTPVIHAITHGQPAIVGLLISHGACIEPKGEYMLGNQSWIFRILTALFIQCANGKGKTDGEGRGGGRQKDERSSKQGTPGSSGRKQGRNPPSGGNGKRKHSDRSSDEDEDYKDQHPSKKEQKIDFPCACPFQAAFPEDHDCLEYTNVARLKLVKHIQFAPR